MTLVFVALIALTIAAPVSAQNAPPPSDQTKQTGEPTPANGRTRSVQARYSLSAEPADVLDRPSTTLDE
jgi:hypothetical protein